MRGTRIAALIALAVPVLWLFKFVVYDTWDAYMYSEARANTRCVVRTDQQAIDAAIEVIVSGGESYRQQIARGVCNRLVDGSCLNPLPYLSTAQFKADNPACCHITSDLPGDLPSSLRERIVSGASPKIYPVLMRYTEYGRDSDGNRISHIREDLRPIDCLGRTVNE